MKHFKRLSVCLVLVLIFGMQLWFPVNLSAADDEDGVGVTVKGITHHIASDRRVNEIVRGFYEAEGLDIYLKRRLDDLAARIDKVDAAVQQISKDIAQLKRNITSSEANVFSTQSDAERQSQTVVIR